MRNITFLSASVPETVSAVVAGGVIDLGERTDCDVSDCDNVRYGERREEKRQYMRSVWQLYV